MLKQIDVMEVRIPQALVWSGEQPHRSIKTQVRSCSGAPLPFPSK